MADRHTANRGNTPLHDEVVNRVAGNIMGAMGSMVAGATSPRREQLEALQRDILDNYINGTTPISFEGLVQHLRDGGLGDQEIFNVLTTDRMLDGSNAISITDGVLSVDYSRAAEHVSFWTAQNGNGNYLDELDTAVIQQNAAFVTQDFAIAIQNGVVADAALLNQLVGDLSQDQLSQAFNAAIATAPLDQTTAQNLFNRMDSGHRDTILANFRPNEAGAYPAFNSTLADFVIANDRSASETIGNAALANNQANYAYSLFLGSPSSFSSSFAESVVSSAASQGSDQFPAVLNSAWNMGLVSRDSISGLITGGFNPATATAILDLSGSDFDQSLANWALGANNFQFLTDHGLTGQISQDQINSLVAGNLDTIKAELSTGGHGAFSDTFGTAALESGIRSMAANAITNNDFTTLSTVFGFGGMGSNPQLASQILVAGINSTSQPQGLEFVQDMYSRYGGSLNNDIFGPLLDASIAHGDMAFAYKVATDHIGAVGSDDLRTLLSSNNIAAASPADVFALYDLASSTIVDGGLSGDYTLLEGPEALNVLNFAAGNLGNAELGARAETTIIDIITSDRNNAGLQGDSQFSGIDQTALVNAITGNVTLLNAALNDPEVKAALVSEGILDDVVNQSLTAALAQTPPALNQALTSYIIENPDQISAANLQAIAGNADLINSITPAVVRVSLINSISDVTVSNGRGMHDLALDGAQQTVLFDSLLATYTSEQSSEAVKTKAMDGIRQILTGNDNGLPMSGMNTAHVYSAIAAKPELVNQLFGTEHNQDLITVLQQGGLEGVANAVIASPDAMTATMQNTLEFEALLDHLDLTNPVVIQHLGETISWSPVAHNTVVAALASDADRVTELLSATPAPSFLADVVNTALGSDIGVNIVADIVNDPEARGIPGVLGTVINNAALFDAAFNDPTVNAKDDLTYAIENRAVTVSVDRSIAIVAAHPEFADNLLVNANGVMSDEMYAAALQNQALLNNGDSLTLIMNAAIERGDMDTFLTLLSEHGSSLSTDQLNSLQVTNDVQITLPNGNTMGAATYVYNAIHGLAEDSCAPVQLTEDGPTVPNQDCIDGVNANLSELTSAYYDHVLTAGELLNTVGAQTLGDVSHSLTSPQAGAGQQQSQQQDGPGM
ncbi:hypothetical protein GC177_06650 [bacterium]|nr:hypothetical protein [bacterium]